MYTILSYKLEELRKLLTNNKNEIGGQLLFNNQNILDKFTQIEGTTNSVPIEDINNHSYHTHPLPNYSEYYIPPSPTDIALVLKHAYLSNNGNAFALVLTYKYIYVLRPIDLKNEIKDLYSYLTNIIDDLMQCYVLVENENGLDIFDNLDTVNYYFEYIYSRYKVKVDSYEYGNDIIIELNHHIIKNKKVYYDEKDKLTGYKTSNYLYTFSDIKRTEFISILLYNKDSNEYESTNKGLFSIYKKLAEQGNPASQYMLGLMYSRDDGKLNLIKSIHYYKLAADQGHVIAQRSLGCRFYRGGNGVEVDYQKAFYYLQLAANKGDRYAQQFLGYMYQHGHGVEKDYKKAVYYYQLSINQGLSSAINYLSDIDPDGHIKNLIESEQRIRKLERCIEKLKYKPGREGYEKTKDHFYSLV